MKFTRLAITTYGPLAGFDEADLGAIQLVCGPNESGKTLLTEALLRLMTGVTPADARVETDVVGFVELDDDGAYRVDADTSLLAYYEDRYGVSLTPAEFRNLFVVRDADLPVEGPGFYERMTDRLTGLRAGDIRTVMAAVRDRGRLTEGELRLSDAKPDGKPKTQRDDARTLLEDVRRYRRAAMEDDLDTTERDRFEAARRAEEVAATVDELEAAEQRAEVESLRGAVADLRAAAETRRSLPESATVTELRNRTTELLEAAIEDDELAARKAHARTLALGSLAVAAVTFLGFAGFSLSLAAAAIPALALGLAAYFARQWYGTSRLASTQARERSAVLRTARGVGLDADDLDGMVVALEAVERERTAATSTVNQAIGALRSGLDLDQPTDPETVAETAARQLDEWARDVPAVDREFDPAALEEARHALDDARETVYRLETELTEHRRRLDAFADRAEGLDFAAFTGRSLDLAISSLDSLGSLERRLEGFVEAIDRDADVARTAHNVLEAMAGTEGEKVADLFGPESRTSELFARVTDGRYEAVRYDAETDEVVVERASQDVRTQRELSRGTRDQLFFCVRVALAEQLLGGARGVFVLDDAFLTADPDRLARQVEVVTTLAEAGWQVLYLTAKPDATATLEPLCPAPIELDPL